MANSISDSARANLLSELTLTEPQGSNVDLMVLLRADGTQVTWTFTDASDAVNYLNYLESLKP